MIDKTISHYKILEKIGSGGMGVVYKAQDLKLDRFVALKFLPPHLTTSDEEKQRFIHEAKAASSLDHNNICNIYEIDETEDGQLFISMAYYEGETLKKKIEGEQLLSINEVLTIAIQIAHGLAIAHESNITHRDLKPANIMITNRGEVKIVDFGLAKLAGQTKLTKEGTTLGTIAYMSPEQTRGESVDHRSDIWSLGVILYEMISGKPPFRGDYDQAVIYGITNEQPEPLTGLRTGVSLELERIANRCISKDPQDRYQHADDLLSELNKLKKESELKTIPTKTLVSKNRFKSVLLPAAIVSIVMLIILVYLLISSGEKKVSGWENSIAVLPFVDLSSDKDQEYFCDGMTEQIISNLAKLPQLKVISRTSVMKYKDTDKTIPEIGRELNVAHVLEGSVRKFGDRIRVTAQLIGTADDFHIWTHNYDREYKELFDVQDDVSEAIATNLLANLSPQDIIEIKTKRPSNTQAYEYYMKGKYFHIAKFFGATYSMDDFNKSELMLKMAIELDPNYAPSYAALADLYNTYYNDVAENEEEKEKYLKLQEKYINEGYAIDQYSADVNDVKGWVYEAKGEIEKAYNSYKKALMIQPNTWDINYSIGSFYSKRGLNKFAIKYFTRAIAFNPVLPSSYNMRAQCYKAFGEFEKAEIDMQKALEINPDHRGALFHYGSLLIILKKYNKAEKIISRREQIYPESNSNPALRAFLLAAIGEKDKALEINLEAWNMFRLYLILKMKEEIIQYLNENFEQVKNSQRSYYNWFMHHPIYEFLHSDPRFQEILAKHKELYEENLAKYGDIEALIN